MSSRATILEAAMPLAERHGYQHVSRAMIAAATGVSETLVSYYWTPADAFHSAILERAASTGNLRVLAQGLIARHPAALAAPRAIRVAAAKAILNEAEANMTENDLLTLELRHRGDEDFYTLLQEIKRLQAEVKRLTGVERELEAMRDGV
jgi:AcrR family transcriptional regulator